MQIKDKPESHGGQQERTEAWERRSGDLADCSSESDSARCELQTLLINTLLATQLFWSTLPAPGPLFGEEFLEAVLQAAKQNAG